MMNRLSKDYNDPNFRPCNDYGLFKVIIIFTKSDNNLLMRKLLFHLIWNDSSLICSIHCQYFNASKQH